MILDYSQKRHIKIIENSIKKVALDLHGLNVLTEVGSNYFAYTPIIAAMAGADQVFAWTRDSSYSSAKNVILSCSALASYLGIENKIHFSTERPPDHVKCADIITNLGFVRPLDEHLLSVADPAKTVLSIMCEAWETRSADINIDFCKKKGFKMAGTWENHPDLKIFSGCGPLAVKIVHEAGFELYQNNTLIWSDDHFGEVIQKSFYDVGANEVTVTTDLEKLYEKIDSLDFIFFCDYDEQKTLIGKEGLIDLNRLLLVNPSVGLIHLYGKLELDYIKMRKAHFYPEKEGKPSVMTYTLAHLGPAPLINLHAAGLKVGECLKKNISHQLVQHL